MAFTEADLASHAPPIPSPSDQDGWILLDVDRALADALRLLRWWQRTDAALSYKTSFDLFKNLEAPDRAIGFFDRAEISTGPIDVMGLSHEMIFDQPKSGSPETYRSSAVMDSLTRFSGIQPRVAHKSTARPSSGRASSLSTSRCSPAGRAVFAWRSWETGRKVSSM